VHTDARNPSSAGPAEIKHDGYRLIVLPDGARVRLFTRNVSSAPRAKKNLPSVNRRA
jgi:ATP-dependent DNA ligase